MGTTTLGLHPRGQRLSEELVRQFEIGRVFKDNKAAITSIDFDDTGEWCLTASNDDSLRMYNAVTGLTHKFVHSKKYGCSLARFTHHPTSIIHASTKEDNTIRYLSTHDNKYLRYFRGHSEKVVDLAINPQNDTFLSSSMDQTVQMWDLRSQKSQATINLKVHLLGRPQVAFDQTGNYFAIVHQETVRIYAVGNFFQPIFTFPVQDSDSMTGVPEIVGIEFGNNGKDILLSTREGVCYLLDLTSGQPQMKHYLRGHENNEGIDMLASLSPDGQFVACGSQDGTLHIWSAESGVQVCTLAAHHEPPTVVKWNPKYMMFASAEKRLAFWTVPPRG